MGEQVSERESLAEVLLRFAFPYAAVLTEDDLARADAVLAWFAEHRGPRVVSTVEELDALPEGSVVRREYSDGTASVYTCRVGYDGKTWSPPSSEDRWSSDIVMGSEHMALTVLFTPTTESEDR